MPLQAVVRQCKNLHSLHIFYFVKGVQYSTDGKYFEKCFFQSGTGIMSLQSVVRQCKNVHTLHIFYFVKGVKYSTDGSILIKQKVFSIRHRYNAVTSGCSTVQKCTFVAHFLLCQRCEIFNGRKHFDKAKSFFNQAQA